MIDEKIFENMTAYTDNWNERICPICGRHFYPPTDEWVYRIGELLLCSWRCLCAFDRLPGTKNVSRYNRGVRRPYRPRLNSEEKRERNKRLLADHARGDSMLLIANRYDITPDHVRRIIKASSRKAETGAGGICTAGSSAAGTGT